MTASLGARKRSKFELALNAAKSTKLAAATAIAWAVAVGKPRRKEKRGVQLMAARLKAGECDVRLRRYAPCSCDFGVSNFNVRRASGTAHGSWLDHWQERAVRKGARKTQREARKRPGKSKVSLERCRQPRSTHPICGHPVGHGHLPVGHLL